VNTKTFLFMVAGKKGKEGTAAKLSIQLGKKGGNNTRKGKEAIYGEGRGGEGKGKENCRASLRSGRKRRGEPGERKNMRLKRFRSSNGITRKRGEKKKRVWKCFFRQRGERKKGR